MWKVDVLLFDFFVTARVQIFQLNIYVPSHFELFCDCNCVIGDYVNAFSHSEDTAKGLLPYVTTTNGMRNATTDIYLLRQSYQSSSSIILTNY